MSNPTGTLDDETLEALEMAEDVLTWHGSESSSNTMRAVIATTLPRVRAAISRMKELAALERGPGTLMVGHTLRGQVVVNLSEDMVGHIVFSPQEARQLAASLIKKAGEAEEVPHA